MDRSSLRLPPAIADRLLNGSLVDGGKGRLGHRLFQAVDIEAGPAYVKVGSGYAGRDLREEAARLDWIGTRLPVPRVLAIDTTGEQVVVLMTALSGTPSHALGLQTGGPAIVERLAAGLLAVHSIPIEGCPFINLVTSELAESERRVSEGLLDEAMRLRSALLLALRRLKFWAT